MLDTVRGYHIAPSQASCIILRNGACTTGRNVEFLGLLDDAVDTESKAKLLGCLVRADKASLTAIGRDEACMEAFESWLEELAPDRPAFHVLELLLKVGSVHARLCLCRAHSRHT